MESLPKYRPPRLWKRPPMETKPVLSRSSNLVTLPALVIMLVSSVLAAFFDQGKLASVLMFLFLLTLASRCWAVLALRRISVSAANCGQGFFPGDQIQLNVEIRNGKFLPLVWLELFFPLSKDLCLVPEENREPDEWEYVYLENEGYSTQMVGERRFSFLLWYETLQVSLRWTAQRRGCYSTAGWRVRTGDGFGLTQVEQPIDKEDVRQFYVYPKLIKVRPDVFLRNLWNADTGAKGVMEDPTVIRSTRDYQAGDPLKHINWRLAARCQPLTVNIYEDILPRSIHFFFDGESFCGPQPHLEEMEDALSVLASQLVRLSALQVRCGLSMCKGAEREAANYFFADTSEMLQALAAYHPCPAQLDDEGKAVAATAVFDEPAIYEAAQSVGRFYYILYDAAAMDQRALPCRLGKTCTTLLTACEGNWSGGEFEVIPLAHLKEGKRDE